MFSKLWAATVAVFAALVGMLTLERWRREKAQREAKRHKQAREVEAVKNEVQRNISDARIKANDEAKQVQAENNDNRGKRPSGNFGDKRLQ